MKCTNCGNEFMGKFCPNCGTPAPVNDSAPVQNEQTQPTEPFVNTPEQTDVTQPVWETPVPENTPEQNVIPEPVQYNPTNDYNSNVQQEPAQPQQTSFGQQFTNSSNGGYTGQQFTNQPQNNAPSGKKGMSTGKIVALVLGIVGGVILILCIIFGVVACNIFNASKDIANNIFDKAGSIYDDYRSNISDVEDSTMPEWPKDMIESEDNSIPSESDDYFLGSLDDISHCYYKYTDGGVKITGYDSPFEYEQNTYTVKIPSKIDGEDVVEIESLGVYNYSGNDDLYIKVVVPGSVKVIREYAFAFNDDINEVVIDDGVETIESYAFYDSENLKSVTVPKSVTSMDDCGLGMEIDDDTYDDVAIDGFVLYGTKGSAAESYAKENNLKFAEAK